MTTDEIEEIKENVQIWTKLTESGKANVGWEFKEFSIKAIEEIEYLQSTIREHNKRILLTCGDKSACGYKQYERNCPNCPREWLMEINK